MSVLGIVTEYNPFHYGHIHHLETSCRQTDTEAVICVMSGSFTQRGEPAVFNKWARAEMAVRAGVDIVAELPFAFAARSSYNFARGALLLLQKTGVVTHVAFGSEAGQIPPLQEIAQILCEEPEQFKQHLRRNLRQGHSFPHARANAVIRCMDPASEEISNELASLLKTPNNILALEYLLVIEKEQLDLIPSTVPRVGPGYHQLSNTRLASATAIRNDLINGITFSDIEGIPPFVKKIMEREIQAGRGPVDPSRTSDLVRFCCNSMTKPELSNIHDISEGLENRIVAAIKNAGTRDEILNTIRTRRYSDSRISRILTYILLNFTNEDAAEFDASGPIYFRLLGFSPKGQKILQEMKAKSDLTVITKMGNISRFKDPILQRMLAFDCKATDLQSLLQPRPGRIGLDSLVSPLRVDLDPSCRNDQ